MGDVLKRGSGWSIRWYEGGKRRVLSTKQANHANAKRMLVEIEAKVARGEAGIPERRAVIWPSVAELVEKFSQGYSRPRIKNIERYRYEARSKMQKMLPYIGKLSAGQLGQAEVTRLRDSLGKEYASGTVHQALKQLSTVFSWGVRQGLAPRNPCKGVELPSGAQSFDFLSREEAALLINAAATGAKTLKGRMLYVGVAVALYTGLRKGELLGLRWIDLDCETRRLTIARSYRGATKSGRARHLRLPSVLIPILREWRPHCPKSLDGSVLPLSSVERGKVGGRDVMLGLRELTAQIGLRSVPRPWHLLRHTFASHFIMSGGNLLALSKILGHSDIKVTMIYAHLAPDFLADEMDRVKF